MRRTLPPFYFIYGEPVRDVGPSFLHVERVGDRRDIHQGKVKDHSHPHLHQLSFWPRAEGRYQVEGAGHFLNGAALTWMPSGMVHGFEMTQASDSIVLSLSDDFVAECLGSLDVVQIRAILRQPLVFQLSDDLAARLEHIFLEIEREYQFPSWGQSVALNACIRLAVITLARIAEVQHTSSAGQAPQQQLFVRFLDLLEQHFREHRSVEQYCTMLGATPYLLNRACQTGSGMRASHVIRTRLLQEAKRHLLYTMRDIGEIGFDIGFTDAAHFGRMFKTVTGQTPAQWRRQNRGRQSISFVSPPAG